MIVAIDIVAGAHTVFCRSRVLERWRQGGECNYVGAQKTTVRKIIGTTLVLVVILGTRAGSGDVGSIRELGEDDLLRVCCAGRT